jgi:hypothetical protein
MEYRLLGENRNGKLRGKKSVVTGKKLGELFFRPFSWILYFSGNIPMERSHRAFSPQELKELAPTSSSILAHK